MDAVPAPEEFSLSTDPAPFAGTLLGDTIAAVRPRDAGAERAARERLDRMTKPPGSLGVLEDVAAQLAGIAGTCPAPLPEPATVAVFAGDHGVHAQGVTPWPQEVTAQMVANFAGRRRRGQRLRRRARVPGRRRRRRRRRRRWTRRRRLLDRKVRPGTADLAVGPAMTVDEARRAVEAGIEVATTLAADSGCLITGDMGIANTTASAALVCAFTGATPAAATGRGTGIDDPTLARKVDVVEPRGGPGARRGRPTPEAALAALAEVGGLEHAAPGRVRARRGRGPGAGAARRRRSPARRRWSRRRCARRRSSYALAGHTSAEPGHARRAATASACARCSGLDLRLGEGTGALLALPLVPAPPGRCATWPPSTPPASPRRADAPPPVDPGAGAVYPVGLRLLGRRVVVVGGGQVAHRRVAGLLEARAAGDRGQPRGHPRAGGAGRARLGHLAAPPLRARRPGRRLVRGRRHRRPRRSTPPSPPRPSGARIFCARADDRAASSVWTPAIGRQGDLVVGVHGGGDPQRAVAVRDAVVAGLTDGTHRRPRLARAVGRRPRRAAWCWSAAAPATRG